MLSRAPNTFYNSLPPLREGKETASLGGIALRTAQFQIILKLFIKLYDWPLENLLKKLKNYTLQYF